MKLEQLEQKAISLVVARLREIELERQTIELEKFIIVYSAVPARIRATTNRAN